MSSFENAIRDLEHIQMALIRVHARMAQEQLGIKDRHMLDRYFDAFASDLVGLEEYLRSLVHRTDAKS